VKSVFPSNTINILGQHAPTLFLGHFFSTSASGNFSLAQRMLSTPSSMLGAAISSVYYSTIAKSNDNEIKAMTFNLTRFLVFVFFPIFMLIAIKGVDIFTIVFGPSWKTAGEYAIILLPWVLIVFICAPIGNLNHLNNRQSNFLKFEVVLLISRCIALFLGYIVLKDALLTVLLFSLFSFVCWLIYFGYLLISIGISLAYTFSLLVKGMFLSFVVVLPILLKDSHISYFFSGIFVLINAVWHLSRRESL
jgi:O-antigen/teichoic acid export membrane protein